MTAPLIQLDVPAEITYLGVIAACLNETVMTQPHLRDHVLFSHNLQLAVHEVGMNIIEHAYAQQCGGRITLTLTVEPAAPPASARLIIELQDTGAHSFDPAAVAAPNLDEPQEGGYGLFLVQHLMDEVSYESHAGGHGWRLIKNLE